MKNFCKLFSLTVLLLFISSFAFAQLSFQPKVKPALSPLHITLPDFKISAKSYGMLLGVQRGKFTFLELGVERHWSKVKLIKPKTYSLGANMEYNFGNNVLGYKLSGWMKIGRVNLTYGANICYYTNFDQNRIGLGPAIGFRLLGFHLVNGYNFTVGSDEFKEFNTLYVSLRYFFPLDKKIRFRKSKKN